MQTLDTLRQPAASSAVAQQLVRTDDLTGLANRRGLYRYLDERRRYPLRWQAAGLLLIDIDQFKQVNDSAATWSAIACCGRGQTRCAGGRAAGDCPAAWAATSSPLMPPVATRATSPTVVGLIAALRRCRACRSRPSAADRTVSVGACLVDAEGGWSDWYARPTWRCTGQAAGGDSRRVAGRRVRSGLSAALRRRHGRGR